MMEMANYFIFYTEKVRKEKLENQTLICKFHVERITLKRNSSAFSHSHCPF